MKPSISVHSVAALHELILEQLVVLSALSDGTVSLEDEAKPIVNQIAQQLEGLKDSQLGATVVTMLYANIVGQLRRGLETEAAERMAKTAGRMTPSIIRPH